MDGLGRRHWKEVQKDFEKWTGFVGAARRSVEWKKVVGWYIGASTEGQRVKGLSTWRANTPSESTYRVKDCLYLH